jgi:glutamate N-acetyltransferase/amino-acid N-acetyltransferase
MLPARRVLAQARVGRYSCPVTFDSADAYISQVRRDIALPRGFRFFSTSLTFVPPERPASGEARMNLAAIVSDPEDTVAVGVTTGNRFCGASVTLARRRLSEGRVRAILVNNKVANVASATGLRDAERLADATARLAGVGEEDALSVSTGVIGWSLPVTEMETALPRLFANETDPVAVAQAIMTTDRYPKLAWSTSGEATCLGVAKGAGMIEPNLATMLGFVMCDAVVEPDVLATVFRRVVDRSFNAISVDSDQSTSDMVVCMANGASRQRVDEDELEALLEPVCLRLAREIVRNGEGTAHVIELTVRGIPDSGLARKVGRHVVNSPLVKTAIHGNDPNVGRLLAATGDALDTWDPEGNVDGGALRISIAGRGVYRDRAFHLDGDVEASLAASLADAAMDPVSRGFPQDRGFVPVVLDFSYPPEASGGVGSPETVTVYGSDLSYEYIRENADYRT